MKLIETVFKRYEKKFLLSEQQADALIDALTSHTVPDSYGISTICNLYYDTRQCFLVRNSLMKPFYKEKLRLRCYGVPQSDSPAFIEIKKKYNGIVFKRRITAMYDESLSYLSGETALNDHSQIKKEIDYLLAFYGHLLPATALFYDRTALFDRQDNSLRFTFDRNIRARTNNLDLKMGDDGILIANPSEVLLEIKSSGNYPLWLVQILSELDIRKPGFSKYGEAYRKLIIKNQYSEKGLIQ